ncbi:hypothetical protein F5B21DRAFT_336551 [Xylaria acuta]|nr:hypothetical protein F5B21DRAFT_336551 [Xylaria acuta]
MAQAPPSQEVNKQTLLRNILHDKSDLREFDSWGITDILLPIPDNGCGLPTYFKRNGPKLREFIKEQHNVGRPVDDLKELLKRKTGDKIDHINLSRPYPEDWITALEGAKGGYAEVYEGTPPEFSGERLALKLTSHGWRYLEHIGEEPLARYPSPKQWAHENEFAILRRIPKTKPSNQRLREVRDTHIIKFRLAFTDPRNSGLLLSSPTPINLGMLTKRYAEGLSKINLGAHTVGREQAKEWLNQGFGCIAAAFFLQSEKIRRKGVKPKNVLVGDDGTFCICDFAMAVKPLSFGGLSTDGEAGGENLRETDTFTSPERLRRQKRGLPDDMFTLGLVYLEMIAALEGKKIGELETYLYDQLRRDRTLEKEDWELLESEEWAGSDRESTFYKKHRDYVPVMRIPCKGEALGDWLGSKHAAVSWMNELLSSDPTTRCTSQILAKNLSRRGQKMFWKEQCCHHVFDNSDSNSSALGSCKESSLCSQENTPF